MTVPALDAASTERLARTSAAQAFRLRLRLPPRLSLSQWADRYRVISAPAAEAGPWRTDRIPYMREIMDTISGTEYPDITVLKCSQSGATEACINNAVGYYIDQEPSSILVIQPNVKPMAEGFSKTRLAPMLRDSPKLRGKVSEARSRDSGNTVLQKSFPGGELVVVGANSPAGLASWPIRVVLADELDRWPQSAGTEGDPLALAEARQLTYRHRKKCVKVTTPGNEGESRGEKEWLRSDQRHFYVPCPHCSEHQPLEWRDSAGHPDIRPGTGAYRLVWEKAEDGTHRPETARYACRACGVLIEETYKPAMLAAGRWVKHNPASRRAGFFVGGLLSPWVRWRDIASKWVAVFKDPEQRKTFFNTLLGLLYQPEGELPDSTELAGRRETYGAEVPLEVGALVCAVDVQNDRLEAEVRGWAAGEESYVIRLDRFIGDPEQAAVWEQLEALRVRAWQHESGATMRIVAMIVDTGYLQDVVYRWVRPRQRDRVFASKGADNARDPVSRAERANKNGIKLVTINPSKVKDVLFARLRRRAPGPGYLHIGTVEQTGADDLYLAQYGAERRTVDFVRNRPVIRYVPLAHRRNEAIDLYVMSLAALRVLGPTFGEQLGRMAERLARKASIPALPAEMGPEPPAPSLAQQAMQQVRRPGQRRGGWATGGGQWGGR